MFAIEWQFQLMSWRSFTSNTISSSFFKSAALSHYLLDKNMLEILQYISAN